MTRPELSPHNARAKHSGIPSKHFRLVCWFLIYKVPPRVTDWRSFVPKACQHAKMPAAAFEAASRRWPRELKKVAEKRRRRLAWLKAHGAVPGGWTPPDPKDRRTANYPAAAMLARMSLETLRRHLKTEYPELFGGGGHDPAEDNADAENPL